MTLVFLHRKALLPLVVNVPDNVSEVPVPEEKVREDWEKEPQLNAPVMVRDVPVPDEKERDGDDKVPESVSEVPVPDEKLMVEHVATPRLEYVDVSEVCEALVDVREVPE